VAGRTFTTVDGLGHNRIDDIMQDRSGKIWFATDWGVSLYKPSADKNKAQFVTFTHKDGLNHPVVNAIVQDFHGHLWIATYKGLNRYDGRQFVSVSNDAGFYRYDGPFFFELSQQDGLADNDVRSLLEDRNGDLWFGTAKGITRYRHGADRDPLTTFTTVVGLVNNNVFDLVEDQQGHIWISTEEGVSRYDSEGKWTTHSLSRMWKRMGFWNWVEVEKLADGCTVDALVVDDRQANRDVLMGLLTRIGVNVRTAENGEIALVDMREKMPDIVFLDIRMPVMDGPEMLKHVFEEFGRNATHVLAVTASVFDHQRKRNLDMGFEDFINKPIQAGEIYAALEKHLNVVFDRTESSVSPDTEPEDVDWSSIAIPADLHEGLVAVTETHSITQLRKQIDYLADQGGSDVLVAQLRELSANFDMDGVGDLLRRIKVE